MLYEYYPPEMAKYIYISYWDSSLACVKSQTVPGNFGKNAIWTQT